MKVAFCVLNFTFRGTEVSLFDYALYNRKILNNISVIVYPSDADMTNTKVVRKFSDNFNMIRYKTIEDLETKCVDLNIDCLYTIKFGKKNNLILKNIPTFVHCVFETSEPHGSVYAGVSPSVSKSNFPYVEHIVDLPNMEQDFRDWLNIPNNAIVFGRHGGADTFNIPFVKESILNILNKNENVYFLFCVRPTILNDIEHDRIFYFDPFVDKRVKRKFINTCDAMIHACSLGESFGLSILEFSFCNKPVITWNEGSLHKQHLEYLKDKAVLYNSKQELDVILETFDSIEYKKKNWNVTENFSPEKIMIKFQEVFLKKV